MSTVLTLPRRFLIWLLSREPGLAELSSGFGSLVWGLVALRTYPLGDEPASVNLFEELHIQRCVAVGAIVLGFAQMFVCDLIDRHWERHWARTAAACAGTFLWGMLAGSALYSGPTPPGLGAFVALLLVNVVLVPRIVWAPSHRG